MFLKTTNFNVNLNYERHQITLKMFTAHKLHEFDVYLENFMLILKTK